MHGMQVQGAAQMGVFKSYRQEHRKTSHLVHRSTIFRLPELLLPVLNDQLLEYLRAEYE
jgi:hypothetical protein